jgi:hypothetical protein
MGRQPLYLVLPFILAACAASGTSQTPATGTRVAKAVTTPLVDLNLLREKIPVVLNEARKNPYSAPADPACADLSQAILALDDALGPDLDVPKPSADPTVFERGTSAAGNAAFDALQGAAEGLVPFRHWVRKLSGAERHSKEVAAAVAAGIVRRSYLKGIGQSLGCQAPAAPLKQEAPAGDLSPPPLDPNQPRAGPGSWPE